MKDIQGVLREAAQRMESVSDSPRLDAELLFCEVSGLSRTQIISSSGDICNPDWISGFSQLVDRRAKGEPVAYILGRKEFFGLDFKVSPSVLIPRPETEILVEEAIRLSDKMGDSISILDLGTGSGCIAVSVSKELIARGKAVQCIAVDKSEDALKIAIENVKRFNLFGSIQCLPSDWFSGVSDRTFDLVLANPPYIPDNDSRVSPSTKFEPQSALYSGVDGLDDLTAILSGLDSRLSSNGVFLSEIGSDQGVAAINLVKSLIPGKFESSVLKDLAGLDRILVLNRNR